MTLAEPTDRTLLEVETAARQPDRAPAFALAVAAMKTGRREPLILRLVAESMERDGLVDNAAELLENATERDPDNVEGWIQYGRILLQVDQPIEALKANRNALGLDPDAYGAHLGAGMVCLRLGDVAGARSHYRRAADLSPDEGEPLSALAVIAARQGDPVEARAFAEQALALNPEFISAQIAIARADTMEGAPALAETRLTALLARADLTDDHRADCLSYLADALDALGRPAEAFAMYTATNTRLARTKADPLRAGLSETTLDQALRLADYFRQAPADAWREAAGEDAEGRETVAGHIFLLGFPRSGTTLLEQVMATHPSVVAIEERGMLAEAAGHFLTSDKALDRLASLTSGGARACRSVYWAGVRTFFEEDVSGKVFIDKLPLHTIALPVIAKLFPAARILFALRDPRDVTLSCFRRRFRINAAMSEFLTLEGTARYYDAVMTLAELYRAKLPLDIHVVRHEALVADFDGEARKALEFIGVDWDPAVRGFSARARASANTPSAAQLSRGLSSEGVGAWRRYGRQLSPVLSILEPWVARYDYAPTEPDVLPRPVDPRVQAVRSRISAAIQDGRWPDAAGEARGALERGLEDPLFHRVRGVQAQQEGRLDQAIEDFEVALLDAPGDPAVLGAVGLCLARAGRPSEGLARLESAIALRPDDVELQVNRGWTLEALGDLASARAAYRRALALDPRRPDALGALAVLAGRAGDWAQARVFAEGALSFQPGQPVATIALAGAEAAQGEPDQAEARLRALLSDPGRASDHERAVAFSALGDGLDSRGRTAEAYVAYEAGAALLARAYAANGAARVERAPAFARRLAAHFAEVRPADWRRADGAGPAHGVAGHVFLLGFPRSGTTLAGQILAGHPHVVTLDERQTLADAVARFYGDAEGLAALGRIDPEDIARYRGLYWSRVRAGGAAPDGKVFVDKLPMNTLGLPLIVKLFPEAKIVFMRRDPRDVVLSCFRRQFALDVTTAEFLTLGGAAGLYDAVMTLTEVYRARLDLDLRVQSYEALVENFDDEIRDLCGFLGLDWAPGLADFAARSADVATPSSAQIARGLNSEGVGAWRRYREPMAPVLPILEPWVARFGYPAA